MSTFLDIGLISPEKYPDSFKNFCPPGLDIDKMPRNINERLYDWEKSVRKTEMIDGKEYVNTLHLVLGPVEDRPDAANAPEYFKEKFKDLQSLAEHPFLLSDLAPDVSLTILDKEGQPVRIYNVGQNINTYNFEPELLSNIITEKKYGELKLIKMGLKDVDFRKTPQVRVLVYQSEQ